MFIVDKVVRFAKFTAPALGGGEIQAKVRKTLLNPLAPNMNIAAILLLGGKRVYLPEGGSLSIGRAKSSDIRILDPNIDLNHAELVHTADGVRIYNHSGKAIALVTKDGKTTDIKPDEPINFEGTLLPEDALIVLGLSGVNQKGNGRYLEIKVETPKEISKDLALALALRANPAIEEVSPEALLKAKDAAETIESRGLTVVRPIDPELVQGTSFRHAKNTGELVSFYFQEFDKANKAASYVLGYVSGIGGILAAILSALSAPILAIPGFVTGAIAGLMLTFIMEAIYPPTREIDDQFKGILDKLSADKIAGALFSRTLGEREHVLKMLDKRDSVKALAVRNIMAEAFERPALPEPKQT